MNKKSIIHNLKQWVVVKICLFVFGSCRGRRKMESVLDILYEILIEMFRARFVAFFACFDARFLMIFIISFLAEFRAVSPLFTVITIY